MIFIVWMFFFDGSSWLLHRELNQEIKKLEGNRDYFQNEISTDKEQIEQLQDSAGLERFAREEYLMKKDNEEIYIIEYQDSIIKNNNE
ncbi:FtsB family cell division protein [Dokdonia sp. Hel_I_53]|uniref:FtsB family cell division protein n=1 Tax=Dokdonia sp. Hel_I_53 TaxID=1566287 RepID=UPI0028F447B4|nr:septum formation initiator family protein [Dokdonia sp. Hel_I_53]